jgi:hypothetical protein
MYIKTEKMRHTFLKFSYYYQYISIAYNIYKIHSKDEVYIFITFYYYYQYISIAYNVYKNTQERWGTQLYVYWFILHFVHWISCCPHAGQFLPKLPAPDKRFSTPDLMISTSDASILLLSLSLTSHSWQILYFYTGLPALFRSRVLHFNLQYWT